MVHNAGNGALLQKLPDKSKSQISGKRQWTLLLEIEKKENKTLNTFQKLLQQISQSPQYNQSSQGQSSKENVYEETRYQELARDLEILVPYLNNSSDETIFGINKIKEQHETMKLQNEIHVKPCLLMNQSSPACSSQCISERNFLQKNAICMIVN